MTHQHQRPRTGRLGGTRPGRRRGGRRRGHGYAPGRWTECPRPGRKWGGAIAGGPGRALRGARIDPPHAPEHELAAEELPIQGLALACPEGMGGRGAWPAEGAGGAPVRGHQARVRVGARARDDGGAGGGQDVIRVLRI